jgi:hypothetical protein
LGKRRRIGIYLGASGRILQRRKRFRRERNSVTLRRDQRGRNRVLYREHQRGSAYRVVYRRGWRVRNFRRGYCSLGHPVRHLLKLRKWVHVDSNCVVLWRRFHCPQSVDLHGKRVHIGRDAH